MAAEATNGGMTAAERPGWPVTRPRMPRGRLETASRPSADHAAFDAAGLVELIVRMVLERLVASGAWAPAGGTAVAPASLAARPAEATDSSRTGVDYAGSLLTLRQVEAMSGEATLVRLQPAAVITPMARDELKRRQVAVRWVCPAELVATARANEWGLAIEPSFVLAESLRRSIVAAREVWRDAGLDARGAAAWVAAQERRAAVLVSSEAARATYLSSQVAGVRAAAVADADAVRRAVTGLDANLIVIEPTGQTIHAIKHICATYRRLGSGQGGEP